MSTQLTNNLIHSYGYTNISTEDKIEELKKNKFIKLFADIYPDPKSNSFYSFVMSPQDSSFSEANNLCRLTFRPLNPADYPLFVYNLKGLHSQVRLRIVGKHIVSNYQRQKVIETSQKFRLTSHLSQKYHLSTDNHRQYLKIAPASAQEIESLVAKLDCSFNDLSETKEYDKTLPINQQVLEKNIFCNLENMKLGLVQEIRWDIDLNKLYYYSKHEENPVESEISEESEIGSDND